jgi:hypothetical protein
LSTLVVTLAGGGVAAGLAGTGSAPEEVQVTRRDASTPVAVGDAGHLYQVVRTCEAGWCRDHFAVSADRGAHWKLQPAPGSADTAGREILVAVNTTVVVAAHQGSPANTTTHWVTTDAGLTWRRATVESRQMTGSDRILFIDGSQVVAVAPGTGRVGAAPAAVPLKQGRPFEAGGAWGVVGFTGEHAAPQSNQAAVVGTGLSIAWSMGGSPDWELQPMPRDDGFLDVTSANGVEVYALYATDGGVEVFASRNGGRTWTRGAMVRDEHPFGRLLATRDGTLWLSTSGGVVSSTDRGSTFHGSGFADTGVLAFATAIDLYVASIPGPSPRTWVSENGRDWVEAPS